MKSDSWFKNGQRAQVKKIKSLYRLSIGSWTSSRWIQGPGSYHVAIPLKVTILRFIFNYFEIAHIPRLENAQANALSNFATLGYDRLGKSYIKHLEKPSMDNVEKILPVDQELSWIDLIIN